MDTLRTLIESKTSVLETVNILREGSLHDPSYSGSQPLKLKIDAALPLSWRGTMVVNGRKITVKNAPYGVQKVAPGLIVRSGVKRSEWEWDGKKVQPTKRVIANQSQSATRNVRESSAPDDVELSLDRVDAEAQDIILELAEIGTRLEQFENNQETWTQLWSAQQALMWVLETSSSRPCQAIIENNPARHFDAKNR